MMKGLFEQRGDGYTYSAEYLFFVMTEKQMLSKEFQERLTSMFPTISEDEILSLIIDREYITVYNDCRDKLVIYIDDVQTL